MQTRVGEINVKQFRALPIGAEVTDQGGVHFRVWAPGHKKVELVLEEKSGAKHPVQKSFPLKDERNGYFSGAITEARAGSLYRYRIDEKPELYPDPASRLQPEGPHGPSCVVDPTKFEWSDGEWKGLTAEGQVIYELHIGTFTREGTIAAAMQELEELARLGVTVIELMPIADFPGRYGWGYDGVDLFAPARIYGEPDDYRRFIDRAHQLGLGVILDVVYNHFGPDGNYLRAFAKDYFTDKYPNEWGDAINFDGKNAKSVREFFVSNAVYWIEEYHFDGFRFDATHQIFDESHTHILAEVCMQARSAAGRKRTLFIAENESQKVRHVRRVTEGGFGFDGLWNDDFHHSIMVRLTGRAEAYYTDYAGKAQELLSALKWGYLYQGQRYAWQHQRRGTPTFGLRPSNFVAFLQNHDQVANSGCGMRIHAQTAPAMFRTATAMLLLSPATPMLFQGQEFCSRAPFLFFVDHNPELGRLVKKGREEFMAQFPSVATPEMQARLDDPTDPATYEKCKLDFSERKTHAPIYALHRDLIHLRKEDAVLRSLRAGMMDGAVLNDDAFVMRFFADDGADRLLMINFGSDFTPSIVPEPLLAPPEEMRWTIGWMSEDPKYGGCGYAPCETDEGIWNIMGHSATFLVPRKHEEGARHA
ncbi:MAG: malto-oligosyltrehalose trehalohydrolase [Acidobacteriota bacterium]